MFVSCLWISILIKVETCIFWIALKDCGHGWYLIKAIWGLCWYNVYIFIYIYIYVYFALPVNLETSSNVANHQSCISTNWYGPFSSPGRQPTTPVKKSWRDIKRHKKTQKHGTYLGVPDRLELLWKVNDVNDEYDDMFKWYVQIIQICASDA